VNSLKSLLIRPFLLAIACTLIAFGSVQLFLPGWTGETLIWIALLWWLFVATGVELIRNRARIGVAHLFAMITIISLLVFFPFEAIRLSDERARFLAETPADIDRSRMAWIGIWGWDCYPGDRWVPNCLVWRLNDSGAYPSLECSTAQQLMMGILPDALALEVKRLDLCATSESISHPSKQQLENLACNLRKLKHLETVYFFGEFANGRFADAVRQLGTQFQLKRLSVEGRGEFAPELLANLLVSSNLNFITLEHPGINDKTLGTVRLSGNAIVAGFSETQISQNGMAELLSQKPSFKYLGVRVEQLSLSSLRSIIPNAQEFRIDIANEDAHVPDNFVVALVEQLEVGGPMDMTNNRFSLFSNGHLTNLPQLDRDRGWRIRFIETKLELEAARALINQKFPNFEYENFYIRAQDVNRFLDSIETSDVRVRFQKQIKRQKKKPNGTPSEWYLLMQTPGGMF
jgi:hypothetical protein